MIIIHSVVIVALVVMAAILTVTTEAKVAVGQIDNVASSLYKNVRTVMRTHQQQQHGLRELEVLGGGTLLATRCFTQCVIDKLTPDECEAFIQQKLEEAGGHEVGDVTIKIHTPRSEEVLATTYWMVEVPTNIQGQFTCDRNDGQTYYPYEWSTTNDGDVPVPDISCQGLSGGECCLKLRQFGVTAGRDTNGYCLGCFVYQEPLIPVLGGSGLTEYQDYVFMSDKCELEQYTSNEIMEFDALTHTKMDSAREALLAFVETPSCGDEFENLLKELYDAATVIAPLSEKIGILACQYCYDGLSEDITYIENSVSDILALLSQPVPSSVENCIIIYTNTNNEIVDIPKLGGSRADDEYDDDCDDHPLPPEETDPPAMECPDNSTKLPDGSCLCHAGTATTPEKTCMPCEPRTISAAGDMTCTPCSEGYVEVNNQRCDICPPGTCQAGDLNECIPCFPGLFQPLGGQNFCLQCSRGSVQPLQGQTSCIPCEDNFVQPKRGQTSCDPCPVGTIEGPRDTCIYNDKEA